MSLTNKEIAKLAVLAIKKVCEFKLERDEEFYSEFEEEFVKLLDELNSSDGDGFPAALEQILKPKIDDDDELKEALKDLKQEIKNGMQR